jgi:hypothetical protein
LLQENSNSIEQHVKPKFQNIITYIFNFSQNSKTATSKQQQQQQKTHTHT